MKYRWPVFLMFVMIFLMARAAAAQPPGPVQNLESSSHRTDMIANSLQMEMTWDAPASGDAAGYFYRSDTAPSHTFDSSNTADADQISDTRAVSQNFIATDADYLAYYFHVAAFDNAGNIGLTTTAGPYLIYCISGDIDGDGKISSQDSVLALKMATGDTENNISPNADIDDDGEIGLPEAIHILRILAGYSVGTAEEYCDVPENSVGTVQYTYDDLNRLVNVVYVPDDEGDNTEIIHTYDGTGNRKVREVICE